MSTVKFLLTGAENTGKSTNAAKIEDSLTISFDPKKYPFKKPHINTNEVTTVDELTTRINTAIIAYKDKLGEFPKTVVFDTVTAFYTRLIKYSNDRFNGFDVHANINKETLAFNFYVEDTLIKNGVNVVIVAHTAYDKDNGKWYVPATGAFKDSGSWLGAVDDASYLEARKAKQHVFHNDTKYPTRTTIDDIPEKQLVSEWDITKHLATLSKQASDNAEFDLS